MIVLSDPQRALELAGTASGGNGASEHVRSAIKTVAGALNERDDAKLPDGPGKDDFAQSLSQLAAGDVKAAIQSLMQVLIKDRYYNDDAARRLGVSLFTLLGDGHPVTRDLRRMFDMYLY
jgi:putative thioredoxin